MLIGFGYEGLTIDEFFENLKHEAIEIIFDVRRNPMSRKKGFAKLALTKRCGQENIKYVHLPALGVASADRMGISDPSNLERLLSAYKAKIKSNRDPEMRAALALIRDTAKQFEKIGVMCFECNQHECHRQFIIEHVENRNDSK